MPIAEQQIRFVCTGQGSHKSREVGTVLRVEGGVLPQLEFLEVSGGRRASLWAPGRPAHYGPPVMRFRCPTCRRDVRIAPDGLRREFDQAAAAGKFETRGKSESDISKLDDSLRANS